MNENEKDLNVIEIRGTVGRTTLSKVGDTLMNRLSVATNRVYKDKNGIPTIETTWHNVTAYEGGTITNVGSIKRGDRVHVKGLLRNKGYSSTEYGRIQVSEILADTLEVIPTTDRQ